MSLSGRKSTSGPSDLARRADRLGVERVEVEVRPEQRVEHLVRVDRVARLARRVDGGGLEGRPAQRHRHAVRVDLAGGDGVHAPVVELVEAAHVVVVDVGCHAHDRSVHQLGELVCDGGNADAGVDHEVAFAPAHVPCVAADDAVDVWLEQLRDAVRMLGAGEPGARDFMLS